MFSDSGVQGPVGWGSWLASVLEFDEEVVEAIVLFGEFTASAIKPTVGPRYRFGTQPDGPMTTVAALHDDT